MISYYNCLSFPVSYGIFFTLVRRRYTALIYAEQENFTSKKFLEIIANNKESRREWMDMVFKYHAKYKKGQNYQIWTRDNHAEHIYSQKFIEQKINYIHQNPVRAGIVNEAVDYIYSSAQNYADEDGLLDVITIDFLWKTVS